MYFIVDIVLILLLILVIVTGVKYGFFRNFVFGILRVLLSVAGAVGAAVGVYFLCLKLGWLDFIALRVAEMFSAITTVLGDIASDENVAFVAKIIAYIPIGIVAFIIGYILVYVLSAFILKLVFRPLFKAREKGGAVKIIDNVLGLTLNLAVMFTCIFAFFGAVHALNEDGRYKNVTGASDPEHPSAGQKIINDLAEPALSDLHENFSASVLGGIIYEYNPFNGLFKRIL